MGVSQTKINHRIDQIARPILVYLAVLCTFWVVHYPIIWMGWSALNLAPEPGRDPRFHHFVAVARMVVDAPIYPLYRLPYWVSDVLFQQHPTYLWLRVIAVVFLAYAGLRMVLSPFLFVGRIYRFFHRIFTGPSDV
jgi:hypothetical protein